MVNFCSYKQPLRNIVLRLAGMKEIQRLSSASAMLNLSSIYIKVIAAAITVSRVPDLHGEYPKT